ncbi:cytochrome p450 [Moniliophthora roreri MCA 2997]|uniref:Cytochrome p450 n=1 Tax=Moniliophthora roreri (strain MCA 2997) TaxID=1381753 RepID=V2XUH7_MONRO|nr:cytochrome p450 [Moniliophthora roreri MCA 2997]
MSSSLHQATPPNLVILQISRLQVVGAVIGLLVVLYLRQQAAWRARNPKGLPLPPGPPGLPIIGNVHQLLGKSIVPLLEKWTREYGPVVHIKLFGLPVIIVGSSAAGKELLETRHQKYSGRPNLLLASEAMQGGMMMPFIHANERFRRVRKLVTTEMRPAAVTQYFNPVQSVEIHRLVHSIIESPKDWKSYIARAIASIIMTTVYDRPLRTGQEADQVVKNVVRLNDELVEAIEAGKNYVDFLPFLRYIPGVPYKKPAAEYQKLAESTYKQLMDEAKANLEAGRPANSIAARLLQKPEEQESDYREQYWALGSFYLAGSDTQSVSSQILIMALATHPHVLARCQAEVDAVVGPDRLPTYDDEPRLPYIKATVRELFRWRPVGPTAIPHASVEDDEYMGYFIPKDAMVIPNITSMHMDPAIFDDPETFNPQRYVDNPSLPGHVFGFGRRVCPGQRVAEHSLFLELATLVWGLDVKQAIDKNTGKPIPINTNRETGFAPGGVMKPYGFAVSITPRSAERSKLLARAVEDEGL